MGYGANANGKTVLIDPMTDEEIGAVPVLDENDRPVFDATGKPRLTERDHWFTLQFKLLWKTDGAAASAASTAAPTSTTSAK